MARNSARLSEVFEGVWVAAGDEENTLLKDCRVHGGRCAVAGVLHWGIWCMPTLRTAGCVAAAAAARSREELERLTKTWLDIYARLPTTPGGRRKKIAAWLRWLRRTVGFAREEVLASLGRIADHRDAPPSGYDSYLERRYYPDGVYAARVLAYPALCAFTDSCAEFAVLSNVVDESLKILMCKLIAPRFASRITVWNAAALGTRTFLRILRRRSLYALPAGHL